ncbi:hypothetical protein C8R47DRAFT_1228450 [Mycena vitilis]|nr:hypothetical protein C8R47DRAFT_1231358 [Mycena vitilis]KAJ6454928.1 hypothetical protein C8R47DRAFT_1228450 [Mycena vitilis]
MISAAPPRRFPVAWSLVLPPPSFFNSESQNDACRLLGTYDHPRDFHLALLPSTSEGNSFTYRSTAPGHTVFRAFLCGQILAVEGTSLGVDLSAQTGSEQNVQRITVQPMDRGSSSTRVQFENDVTVLHDVMLGERTKRDLELIPWAERHSTLMGDQQQDYIHLFLGDFTKINGQPIGTGSYVAADVSLHRRDIYTAGGLCKASVLRKPSHAAVNNECCQIYSIIAHELETVHKDFLAATGIIVAQEGEVLETTRGIDELSASTAQMEVN